MKWLPSIPYPILFSFHDFTKIFSVIAVVAMFVCVFLFHVSKQIDLIRLGYQIADATKENQRLHEEHRKLTIEVAIQNQSNNLEDVAQKTFGLQPVQPEQVINLPAPGLSEIAH